MTRAPDVRQGGFDMSMPFKPTTVAVVLVAVLAAGCSPGTSGSSQRAAPSSAAAPSPSPRPSPSPFPEPALTETFTSDVHGLSITYPAGWKTRPATERWTSLEWPRFQDTSGDFMYDPAYADHLFLGMASQRLGRGLAMRWRQDVLTQEGCDPQSQQPIAIDGTVGFLSEDCRVALVVKAERGYWITLYASADSSALDAAFNATFDRAWFEKVLATVKLDPISAADPPST
jgi:hypothetical protein